MRRRVESVLRDVYDGIDLGSLSRERVGVNKCKSYYANFNTILYFVNFLGR